VSNAKTAELIEMSFGDVDSGGPREPCIRRGPESRSPHVNGVDILRARRGRLRTCSDTSCGPHTQSDSAGNRTGTVRMSIGCTRWRAHIGATYRIRLNCPCVEAMGPMPND